MIFDDVQAEEFEIPFYETSAKTKAHVEETFTTIAFSIQEKLENNHDVKTSSSVRLNENNTLSESTNCCK